MSEQIDLKTVGIVVRSKKTADQQEQDALDVGASALKKGLNKGGVESYLSGKTFDNKPFAFSIGRNNDGMIEITGFEFEGRKYKASESFMVKENITEKDTIILQDALAEKSVSIPGEGRIDRFLGTKKKITFQEVGRTSSIDMPEKQGDMKLALAQATGPFKSEHNVLPPAPNRGKGHTIG